MEKSPPSPSPSQQEVMSNEDLLAEILSHISGRSLMRLKLVSKQWLSLITTSKTLSLIHHHRHLGTCTAIFMQNDYVLDLGCASHAIYLRLDLKHVDNSKNHTNCLYTSPFRRTAFTHHSEYVRMLQSCHGLLLFSTGGILNQYNQPRDDGHALYYYVYNPTTNRAATIDVPWHRETTIHASVLVFDPDKSMHYRLVFFLNKPPLHAPGMMQCEVYSSQTRTWKSSRSPFVPSFNITMRDFAYFKGCIYWTSTTSSWNMILYYNVDKDVFGNLPRPGNSPWPVLQRRRLYFGESAGHLHLIETFAQAADTLDVYELNSDCSGWFLMYKVDLAELSRYFPGMHGNTHTCPNEYAFDVLSLIRREHINEDSVLILEVPGKHIVYNLVGKTWKLILKSIRIGPFEPLYCGNYRAFEYIESLAYV